MRILLRTILFVVITQSLGCATVETILQKHKQINFYDGIDSQDATLIAQKAFLEQSFKAPYNVLKPQMVHSQGTKKYPNLWFVLLPPLDPKYQESFYLIAVDRFAGGVIRMKEVSPSQLERLDRLFD